MAGDIASNPGRSLSNLHDPDETAPRSHSWRLGGHRIGNSTGSQRFSRDDQHRCREADCESAVREDVSGEVSWCSFHDQAVFRSEVNCPIVQDGPGLASVVNRAMSRAGGNWRALSGPLNRTRQSWPLHAASAGSRSSLSLWVILEIGEPPTYRDGIGVGLSGSGNLTGSNYFSVFN